MPDQPSSDNTALENLYVAIKQKEHMHKDDPQLLLFIGAVTGSVEKVTEAIEEYMPADPSGEITARNQFILRCMDVQLR